MENWDIIIQYIFSFFPAAMFSVCTEHLLCNLCSWALPKPFVLCCGRRSSGKGATAFLKKRPEKASSGAQHVRRSARPRSPAHAALRARPRVKGARDKPSGEAGVYRAVAMCWSRYRNQWDRAWGWGGDLLLAITKWSGLRDQPCRGVQEALRLVLWSPCPSFSVLMFFSQTCAFLEQSDQ